MSDITGRFKDRNWHLANSRGEIPTWEQVQVALLMDIRDELKRLNAVLYCRNFLAVPQTLKQIHRKLPTKPKAKKK